MSFISDRLLIRKVQIIRIKKIEKFGSKDFAKAVLSKVIKKYRILYSFSKI